jgi:SAM-dependent methyltransferase
MSRTVFFSGLPNLARRSTYSMNAHDLKTQFKQQSQAALSLNIAYIGIVNGLFSTLHSIGSASAQVLAQASGMDSGYVQRWCDAAYAFAYLEVKGEVFSLSPMGDAMRPDAADTLMPMAIQSVLSAHMAERAAGFMRTGERPGEVVLAERATVLPWFGPMLEASFAPLFEHTICPAVAAFAEVNARGGLAVDLGCGNGWYLRALARQCPQLRGLGLDGFAENVQQAQARAKTEKLENRLSFQTGDIHNFKLGESADLIAMNRALHHVWEKDQTGIFNWLHDNLKPGGFAVIWEPAWPEDHTTLREPGRKGLAFQNLSEYVQGNHFLRPQEIVDAFEAVGMNTHLHLFSAGNEAVVVAQKSW